MARFRVMDGGLPVEGEYTKLGKAQREAKKYWERQNPRYAGYVEAGFSLKRDGTHSLWVDDGFSSWHTEITVERQ